MLQIFLSCSYKGSVQILRKFFWGGGGSRQSIKIYKEGWGYGDGKVHPFSKITVTL